MKQIGVSLGLYGAGLSSLLLVDLIITNTFTDFEVAQWAVFRSLVGISAVLPLIGLEQVLVRHPRSNARVIRLLALQIPLGSLVVGLVLQWLDMVPHWALGAALSGGSAVSLLLFHYFRAHNRRVLSQIGQQGWKILALGVVVFLAITARRVDLFLLGTLLILVVDAVGLLAILRLPPGRLCRQDPEPTRALYAIGSRFMLTALLLSLAVYGEQLVVNRLGTIEEAALYFTMAIYFLFPASFINGFMAFLLGPWVRDNRERFVSILVRHWSAIVAGLFVYGVILTTIGWIGWQVTAPAGRTLDPLLQVMLTLAVLARTAYLIPTAYIGILGTPRRHDIFILMQVASLALAAAMIALMLGLGFSVIHAVAAASALNWWLRSFAGFAVFRIVHRDWRSD